MTDPTAVQSFLDEAPVGYLAVSLDDRPYCVALNFVFKDGRFYFHAGAEGRKISILRRNPQACLTIGHYIATAVRRT